MKPESCDKPCSPSDYYKGGKCDLNGCYQESTPQQVGSNPEGEGFEKWLLKNGWRKLNDDNYAHEYRTWGGFPVYKRTDSLYAEYLQSQSPQPPTEQVASNPEGEVRYFFKEQYFTKQYFLDKIAWHLTQVLVEPIDYRTGYQDAINDILSNGERQEFQSPQHPTEQVVEGGINPVDVIKKAYEQTYNVDVADTEITDEKGVRAYQIINEIQDILGIYLEGEHKLWKEEYAKPNNTGNIGGNSANTINPEFKELFEFDSTEDKLEHKAHMISFRALSEIEKICEDRGITHKRLAEFVAVSESYLSQIFNGDKQINTSFLAKVENALNIRFEFNVVNLKPEKI